MWHQTALWREASSAEPDRLSDPTLFDHAAERIQQEAHSRWQLDVYDVAALAHADDEAERDRLTAVSTAHSISHDAGVAPPTSTESYDTHGRRERLKQRMIAADIPKDVIEARVLADTAQACPVTEAVQHERGPLREPRRSKPRSNARHQRQSR